MIALTYSRENGFFREYTFQGEGVDWLSWWLDNISPHEGMSKQQTLIELERLAEVDALRMKEKDKAMLAGGKRAVLFSDYLQGENYHIITHDGRVHRDMLITDRRKGNTSHVYTTLYQWMIKLGIDRLWVSPDTQLSLWTNRADFNLIQGLDWFSPERKGSDRTYGDHPFALRLGDSPNRYIYFPAYGNLARVHRHGNGWILPSPDNLLHSVEYLEEAMGYPFVWSAATSSKHILRVTHKNRDIAPFRDSGKLWKELVVKMVSRPMWSHRLPTGKRGLTDRQKKQGFVIVIDKNMQFLGACFNNDMGIGAYKEVDGDRYHNKSVGFWEYELVDVSKSWFNGYGNYCPLSVKDTWASSELLDFASHQGIRFKIKRGIIWEQEHIESSPMRKWAEILGKGIEQLRRHEHYQDAIAVGNALATAKMYYVEMIGQLTREYSDEYYHPDWNMRIIHKAISNQGYSIALRRQELEDNIIMVSNDAMYLLSDSPDPTVHYSSLLTHDKEMRGYKFIGVAPLTDEIIAAFETCRYATDIEAIIRKEMRSKYATT